MGGGGGLPNVIRTCKKKKMNYLHDYSANFLKTIAANPHDHYE